jgi:thiamine pyrophosphokinase
MYAAIWTAGDLPRAELLDALLQGVKFSVAADAGVVTAKNFGYTPDFWVGDSDSGEPPASLPPQNVFSLNRNKDLTDTEFAVNLALKRGATSLLMIGGGGRRMDHWLSNLDLLRRTPELKFWITGFELATRLQAPSQFLLKPGLVSIFSLEQRGKITGTGLKWPIDELDFAHQHSLSNLVEGDSGVLKVNEGLFIVIQPFAGT